MLSDRELMVCIDELIVARSLSVAWLAWFVDNEARHLPGRARTKALVASLTEAIESVAEARLARLLANAGIAFVAQHPIWQDGRIVARADFALPVERLAIEVDGYRFHSAPLAFDADHARRNTIHLAKWRLLTFTPRQIKDDPAGVIKEVRSALHTH
jgi:very-short-patch-repair endonuclease